MHMITEWTPRFHPRYSHRILYAGNDLMLLQFLQYTLEGCQVIRCPNGAQARLFIEKIKYSLLLFDEQLPDTTGAELESFTRTLAQRHSTPIVIIRDSSDGDTLVKAIRQKLR
jgi:DNA-binding response OmpR family regulator